MIVKVIFLTSDFKNFGRILKKTETLGMVEFNLEINVFFLLFTKSRIKSLSMLKSHPERILSLRLKPSFQNRLNHLLFQEREQDPNKSLKYFL